jgi:hypothetical protein
MSKGLPGWQPHRIVTRVDGWIADPNDETRIPLAVAEVMARNLPQPSAVEIIRARMQARQRLLSRAGDLSDV